MASTVLWMVTTGVDHSHMHDSLPPFDTHREAVDAMQALKLEYPVRHARVSRLEFDHPLRPASRVDVVATRADAATVLAA